MTIRIETASGHTLETKIRKLKRNLEKIASRWPEQAPAHADSFESWADECVRDCLRGIARQVYVRRVTS